MNQGWNEREPMPQIEWIVFPSYDPEGDNQLSPIAPALALVELAKSCSLVRAISSEHVGRLVSLLERVKSYELSVSSVEAATQTLTNLYDRSET